MQTGYTGRCQDAGIVNIAVFIAATCVCLPYTGNNCNQFQRKLLARQIYLI